MPEVEEELPARGEISYIEEDIKDYGDDMASLKLTTETAWVACSELMDKIAENMAFSFSTIRKSLVVESLKLMIQKVCFTHSVIWLTVKRKE